MPKPAYFKTIEDEIINGYRVGRFVDEKRAALVGDKPPQGLGFEIAGNGNILVKIQGKLVPLSTKDRMDSIALWNSRFMQCGNLNAVNAIKRELIAYLVSSIEHYLIFRELGDEGSTSYGKEYVRDEEER